MELKVWVEGIQRIVCGVTTNTTCQDVVFALAHATGATGRFTLIERWRNNERLLAPHENPLKLLLKWGEYANDVQFILQRSENRQQNHQQQQQQQQQLSHASNNISGNAVNASKSSSVNNNNPKDNATNPINTNNRNLSNSNNSSNDNSAYNLQLKHQQQQQQQQKQQTNAIDYNFNTHHYDKSKELRKSFGAHDIKANENVGVVRGIPQHSNMTRMMKSPTRDSSPQRMQTSPPLQQQQQQQPHLLPRHEKSHSNPIEMSNSSNKMFDNYNAFNNNNSNNNNNNNNIYHQIGAQNSKSINEINLAEVRSALDQRANQVESMEIIFSNSNANNNSYNNTNNNNNGEHSQNSNEHLLDVYNGNVKFSNASRNAYTNAPAISANGALVPPPYRNPPPPRNSPLQQQQQQMQNAQARSTNPFLNDFVAGNTNNNNNSNGLNNTNDFNFEYQNFGNANASVSMGMGELESESIFQASQYNDLLQLIKYQREKITTQQMELSKFDAEICFLETKERDQAQELEAIAREITKADQIYRQGGEQLQTLQYVEEENELVKQQEKTLKSEIALLRSKLANCETELLQCKNKMRLLMDDIEMEQRDISNMQKTNRQNVERDFLMEMERIQSEIDQAILNTDTTNKTAENLKKEITLIENAIADKKRQLEQLINEMKEVNLQSLTVTTSEEIKHFMEGPNKPGSTRRIIGSPRQLENAVPTSKNPHGVWV